MLHTENACRRHFFFSWLVFLPPLQGRQPRGAPGSLRALQVPQLLTKLSGRAMHVRTKRFHVHMLCSVCCLIRRRLIELLFHQWGGLAPWCCFRFWRASSVLLMEKVVEREQLAKK
jgi:hypothetical protein